jgi:hypothetical protein
LGRCKFRFLHACYTPTEIIFKFSDGRVYTWATEEVPQKLYNCGNTQNSWEKHLPILFSSRLSPGVRLLDAFRGNFEGIDDRDTFPLGTDTRGMSIRIHVGSLHDRPLRPTHFCFKLLGYPSSTDVEKELKKLADRGGKDKVKKSKARSMQVHEGVKSRGGLLDG